MRVDTAGLSVFAAFRRYATYVRFARLYLSLPRRVSGGIQYFNTCVFVSLPYVSVTSGGKAIENNRQKISNANKGEDRV